MLSTRIIFATMCLLLVENYSADAVCMDGIKDEFEQCDDGNRHNSDGCSIDCLLENEMKWLCNSTAGKPTICCSLLLNPVTFEKVCACGEGQHGACGCVEAMQPDTLEGFTITKECNKRDIDECNTNNGGCHARAICTNINITDITQDNTHTCVCRPGLLGDGVNLCEEFDD
jgi:cysteine-rich repeat protein